MFGKAQLVLFVVIIVAVAEGVNNPKPEEMGNQKAEETGTRTADKLGTVEDEEPLGAPMAIVFIVLVIVVIVIITLLKKLFIVILIVYACFYWFKTSKERYNERFGLQYH